MWGAFAPEAIRAESVADKIVARLTYVEGFNAISRVKPGATTTEVAAARLRRDLTARGCDATDCAVN
jgi:hypothetical protein